MPLELIVLEGSRAYVSSEENAATVMGLKLAVQIGNGLAVVDGSRVADGLTIGWASLAASTRLHISTALLRSRLDSDCSFSLN